MANLRDNYRRKMYLTGIPINLGLDDSEIFAGVTELAVRFGPIE